MPKKPQKISISITVDDDLLKRLDEYRERLMADTTRTHIINLAIRRFLGVNDANNKALSHNTGSETTTNPVR